MALIAGTSLGPYEVVAPLGAGGMGEVYRALDPRLGREVAIKVLPGALAQDADRLRRFEQEARAVGALNHPHILAVYDTGRHEDAPYVVSELLEGQTLRDRLAGGPLAVRKAVEIAVQIARGLAAAHDKGIVHRDLKPENVFITRDGHVKILDFGLAKLTQPAQEEGSALATRTRGTDAGTVVGTVGYMSPEQVRGQAVDHRSDLFALGAILYEMLSGRRAFRRDTQADTMAAILNEEPPELTSVNPALPPALERIVGHCLEKDREERFASARDLAFDLQSLSDSGPHPGKGAASARRWRGRWPWAVALLLWTAVVSAVSVWLDRPDEAALPTYRPLTFRRGSVTSARFSPDGTYFFYSAAWNGGPASVYSTRLDVPGDQDLGLEGDLVAVVPGELFVLRPDRVLVRANLAGQGAREVAEGVDVADVSADGARVAVVRRVAGKDRLESPPGTSLYETSGGISAVRISPEGDRLALLESPQVGIIPARIGVLEPGGPVRMLTALGINVTPVWSPEGTEIWFANNDRGHHSLRAASLSGRERTLLPVAQRPFLHDARAGRWLLTFMDVMRGAIRGLGPGMATERDFPYLDGPQCFELSADGKTLVLSTLSTFGAAPYSVYLGRFDGSPPVRLGPGFGGGFSPDGRQLAVMSEFFSSLALLPTGPGTTRQMPAGTIKDYYDVRFLPDGRALLIAGSEAGRPRRLFLQDLEEGLPRPITPEGVTALYSIPSPDGQWVAAGLDWKATPDALYPLRGGDPRPIPGLVKGEQPLRFDADGTHLLIRTDAQNQPFARIARLDLRSGRKELWKEMRPPDPAGVSTIDFVYPGADGRSYVYNYFLDLSTLYLVDGLR